MKNRTGRNDKCPCGSGRKYKHCCLNRKENTGQFSVYRLDDKDLPSYIKTEIKRAEAKEKQRIRLQGKGRSIIASKHQDGLVVNVGEELFFIQGENKTFHEFLCLYLYRKLGRAWFDSELKKQTDIHPLIDLYHQVSSFWAANASDQKGRGQAVMTGAVSAYLALAYNLYVLQHNVEVSRNLIKRLKDPNRYLGAFYETFIDALFIKSGFDIALEDESGRGGSACEFVATHTETGRKFSVEAKAREPHKTHNNVHGQLHKALKKDAKYERVVFIVKLK